MANDYKLFKYDKYNIPYLNNEDIKITPFTFRGDIGKNYQQRRKFYHILGIDDYIIKETGKLYLMFNERRTKKLLKCFQNKQALLPEIDFPIAYYEENNKMKGLVIPYYENAINIKELVYFYPFSSIRNIYDHEEKDINNLASLCLDILDILEEMYNNDIVYTDVNMGNFLIYQNEVKIIDFEADYVIFSNRKEKYLHAILRNYMSMVNVIWRRLGFCDVVLFCGNTFDETREIVEGLKRGKRKSYEI